jgi:hypothetical protein
MDVSVVKNWLKNRLPAFQDVLAVYGLIVLLIYGWTIYWYLWKLPSWLYFLSLPEILFVYTYAAVLNFIETLIVIALPLALCLALPVAWMRDRFVSRSVILVIVLLAALINYVNLMTSLLRIPPGLAFPTLLAAVVTAFLMFVAGRVGFIRKAIEEIASRSVIFVYIFLPLTALSFLVVLARNIVSLVSR